MLNEMKSRLETYRLGKKVNRLLYCLTLVLMTACTPAKKATTNNPELEKEKQAVIKVIQTMFDGMRAGDSTMVRSAFYKNATMLSTFRNRQQQPKIHKGDLEKFLVAVGTPHEEVWDERIKSYEVKIDATLATAWTEYAFYLGDKFSHCGVNAFHLFKSEEGWKIFHLADTRRKSSCEESKK